MLPVYSLCCCCVAVAVVKTRRVCFLPHQLVQGEAQAAVFVQDEEASLPFLTSRQSKSHNRVRVQRTVGGECFLLQDLPWTAAWGCRSPSPLELNTASRRRRVSPGIEQCKQKKDGDSASVSLSRLLHKWNESLLKQRNTMFSDDSFLIQRLIVSARQ